MIEPSLSNPVVDKPVIQYIVEEALQSGIEEILIITGHGKRAIEDHFDTNVELEHDLYQEGKAQMLKLVQDISAINVHYIHQKHIRGLGDAILCAKSFILHDALRLMLDRQTIYAYSIQGKRYDTANKLDYLKATVEYALRRTDLGPSFRKYLKEL